MKNSEVIDGKLRELVDALGRISEYSKDRWDPDCYCHVYFQESSSQKWISSESSWEHSVWMCSDTTHCQLARQ